MYTQGPLHPYLYGLGQHLFGPGLLSGRWTSWLLFLVASALAGSLAARRGGVAGALIAWTLVASAWSTLWLWTLPLTHAAAGCFLLLGAWCLTGPPGRAREAVGVVALAVATAVRISLAGTLVVAVIAIAMRRRSIAAGAMAAAVAAVALAAIVGPFALASPDNFLFGVWGYHAQRTQEFRAAAAAVPAGVWWAGKANFVAGVARTFTVPVVALALAAWIARGARRPAENAGRHLGGGFLSALLVVTTAISMIPHPVHVTYAAVLVPLTAALAGGILGEALRRAGERPGSASRGLGTFAGFASLALLAAAIGLALHHADPSELARVRAAAAAIDRAVPPGPILTFQNLVTVENRRPLLPGLEMGPFALWPYLDDAEASRRHVLNAAGLCERVRSGEAAAILMTRMESGQLQLRCGDGTLGDAILRSYEEVPALRTERFGQYGAPQDGGDALFVLVRRPAVDDDAR